MGRRRGFEEAAVIAAACAEFTGRGYEAASIDDLVAATGLARGSLYQAFGSKRGIFLTALRQVVAGTSSDAEMVDGTKAFSGADPELDLVLVAALELAPRDAEIRALVSQACRQLDAGSVRGRAAELLGRRLLARAGVAQYEQAETGDRGPAVASGSEKEGQ
jgi:TetR/AcrR family transcriptional repressor of nem operon